MTSVYCQTRSPKGPRDREFPLAGPWFPIERKRARSSQKRKKVVGLRGRILGRFIIFYNMLRLMQKNLDWPTLFKDMNLVQLDFPKQPDPDLSS
jgi:hypothetical protein